MHKVSQLILENISHLAYKNNTEIVFPDARVKLATFKNNPIDQTQFFSQLDDESQEALGNVPMKDQTQIKLDILKGLQGNDEFRRKAEQENMTDRQRQLNDRFILCRDTMTNDFVLFDKVKRRIPDWICSEAYLDVLPGKIAGHKAKFAPLARLVFDAYDSKPFKKEDRDGIEIMRLNAYVPPLWQVKYPDAPKGSDEPPELFTRFLDNLVPDAKEQKIVVDWVANALTRRNQSYLSLRGMRGNGKTLFMKLIMAVIGHYYFAKDGITKDGFNADLKDKRIVGIDDDTFIGSYQGHRLRKQLTNTSVTYNAKFKQTTKSERQYASYIIASNDEDPFYVTHEERKIVCVALTESNAIDFLTEEERDFIDELPKEIEADATKKDLKFLAHLGHYLLNYAKNNEDMFSPNAQYGGGAFWDDVVKSLSLMSRIAVEKALSGEFEEVSYDELLIEFDEHKSMGGREVKKRFPALAKELMRFRYGEGNRKVFAGADPNDLMFKVDPYWVKDLDI